MAEWEEIATVFRSPNASVQQLGQARLRASALLQKEASSFLTANETAGSAVALLLRQGRLLAALVELERCLQHFVKVLEDWSSLCKSIEKCFATPADRWQEFQKCADSVHITIHKNILTHIQQVSGQLLSELVTLFGSASGPLDSLSSFSNHAKPVFHLLSQELHTACLRCDHQGTNGSPYNQLLQILLDVCMHRATVLWQPQLVGLLKLSGAQCLEDLLALLHLMHQQECQNCHGFALVAVLLGCSTSVSVSADDFANIEQTTTAKLALNLLDYSNVTHSPRQPTTSGSALAVDVHSAAALSVLGYHDIVLAFRSSFQTFLDSTKNDSSNFKTSIWRFVLEFVHQSTNQCMSLEDLYVLVSFYACLDLLSCCCNSYLQCWSNCLHPALLACLSS
eukprot:TRINITY_DN4623_c0_g1_i1.p1 TRINITY_DN4623_c0_g1~~TRINITY_DN4623_c0_g1_i1.p1  ORF type:complete len:395 (+),score=-31.44 TRINITY_DN4623_c0_g1_i1:124-1308(+)